MTDDQKQAIDELEAALARTEAVRDPASLAKSCHDKYVKDAHVIQSWCNADGLSKLLTASKQRGMVDTTQAAGLSEKLIADIAQQHVNRDWTGDYLASIESVIRAALAAQAVPVIYVNGRGELVSKVSAEQVESVLGPHVDAIRAASFPAEANEDGNDWQHLKQFGYAPGNYMSRCRRCGQTPIMDKRAVTCRPCAEFLHAAATPQSAAEAFRNGKLVEAVARAICFADSGSTDDWEGATDLAQAAINVCDARNPPRCSHCHSSTSQSVPQPQAVIRAAHNIKGD